MRAGDVKFTGYVARMFKAFEILVLMGIMIHCEL